MCFQGPFVDEKVRRNATILLQSFSAVLTGFERLEGEVETGGVTEDGEGRESVVDTELIILIEDGMRGAIWMGSWTILDGRRK